MISALDVPACPACGSREVHPVQTGERVDCDVFAHTTRLKTFFACRGCGRDQTDAWAPLQNRLEPIEPGTLNTVIGPPDLLEDPPDPLDLGIGATIKATT